ncbi:DNA cytosine methyltransferase [Ornithinimicrobium cerasi]|uniref:DNA cytosine methyltransferase n=1 Tax=Ornithinimicrobium cerasi TaxID=2248773 RepID=UPI000BE4474E|nr:DNA cytosine methyltransferase [Ornithinimicrobium cerasi]
MVRLRRRDRARTWGDADPVALHIINASLGFDASTKINDLIARGYIRRNGDRFDLRHTFNGKSRRLAPDVPAPTVTSRFADPYSFLHPHEERGFTPREAARLQSFPDSFQFIGPSKAAMRLIGNAMPPLVAAQLAETTVRSLL